MEVYAIKTLTQPEKLHILPGCDCNGPYFAYEANCVWEQSTGRFGWELRSLDENTGEFTVTSRRDLTGIMINKGNDPFLALFLVSELYNIIFPGY